MTIAPARRPHDVPRAERLDVAAHVLLDAWLQGDQVYWLRRADDFARVGTPACDEIAQACRNRAQLTYIAEAEFRDTLRDLTQGAAA